MSIITDISKLKRYSSAFQSTEITVGATGPVGGDLSGTLPNPTVVGFYGRPLCVDVPGLNSSYVWDGTCYKPTTISGSSNGGSNGGGVISGSQTNTMTGESMVCYVGEPVKITGTWTAGAPNVPPTNWTNATTASSALTFSPNQASGAQPKHVISIKAFGTVQDISKIGAVFYEQASLTGFTGTHTITKLVYPTQYSTQKIMLNTIELTYNTGSFTSTAGGFGGNIWATLLVPNTLINNPTIIPSVNSVTINNNLKGYPGTGWMPMYFPAPSVNIFVSDGSWTGNSFYLNKDVNSFHLYTPLAKGTSDFGAYGNCMYSFTAADETGFASTSDTSGTDSAYQQSDEPYLRICVPLNDTTWTIDQLKIVKIKIVF